MDTRADKRSVFSFDLLVLHLGLAGLIWAAVEEAGGAHFLWSQGSFLWEGEWSREIFAFAVFRDLFHLPPDWIPASIHMLMIPDLHDGLVFLGGLFCLAALMAAVFGAAGWLSGAILAAVSGRRLSGVAWALGFQAGVLVFAVVRAANAEWHFLLGSAAEVGMFVCVVILTTAAGAWLLDKAGRERIRRRVWLAPALAVVLGACLSFWFPQSPSPGKIPAFESSAGGSPAVNKVLLLTIDTLRYDHTTMGRHQFDTTPALSALAERGVFFERCFSPSSWTLPSMMSLFTGMSPLAHGVEDDDKSLSSAAPTLPLILRLDGFHTAAFYTHIYVSSLYGFQRGFETFEEFNITENFKEGRQPRAGQVNEKVFKWLDENHARPFFLAIHYFDPHWNYDPLPPFDTLYDPDYRGSMRGDFHKLLYYLNPQNPMDPRDLRHLQALYDGEIAYTDMQISELFDKLKSLGIFDDLLIIVTSDHGEEFKEHGGMFHIRTLYQEVLHVPLIIRFPQKIKTPYPPGSRVEWPVTNTDIAPTILDSLGLSPYPGFAGVSLLHPGDRSALMERPVFSKTLRHASDKVSMIWKGVKYIHNYRPGREKEELYDLVRDPAEKHNLAFTRPEETARMREAVFAWVRGERALRRAYARGIAPVVLDKDTLRRLKSIGYF